MKKHLFILLLGASIIHILPAQNTYEDFVRQRRQEMTDFKNKADAEFAKYLQESWAEFTVYQATAAPQKPKPKTAPVVPPETVIDLPKIPDVTETPDVEIPVDETPFQELPIYSPTELKKKNYEEITVDYFGFPLYFHIDTNMRFRLSDVKEEAVAKVWEQLSKADYTPLIESCQSVIGTNGDNDWAFYCLAQKIASSFFSQDAVNEQYLLQMFILTQAGYKVKIARGSQQLFLLTASEQPLYGINYLMINDQNYYILNAHLQKSGDLFYTYKKDFSSADNKLDLIIKKPLQNIKQLKLSDFQAKGCNLKITICNDEILKAFYATYPQCDVVLHAEATVSTPFSEMILPQMKQAVEGKTQQEAVSMILNFCQTAFEYMTDPEQFGYEKPFFPEELFYYPYSDCEDRSIIFTYLVRNVLNMDAVLLDYPQHIAAAVRFDDSHIDGDFVMVGNTKYIICDPTYINASIGMEMPEFKSKGIKAIPIEIKE